MNYDTVSKGGEGGLLVFSATGEIPAEAEEDPDQGVTFGLASGPVASEQGEVEKRFIMIKI